MSGHGQPHHPGARTLLERDALVDELETAWRAVRDGRGSLILVGGEAGAGKTALVDLFTQQVSDTGRVLEGACDPLITPAPLGPLVEVAQALGPDVAHLLDREETPRHLFARVLDSLATRPTALVLEDIHWADEGTLDLLRFLGRRVSRRSLLVLATHRSEGRDVADHPVTTLAGDLATAPNVSRVTVPRLSAAAVAQLCSTTGHDPEQVQRLTGGNAFLVTELLDSAPGAVPGSVRGSVVARRSRLSAPAQRVLDLAAVIGTRIDRSLLASLSGAGAAIDETIGAGFLEAGPTGAGLRFQHELVRNALEDVIPQTRRASLHATVLAELRRTPEFETTLAKAAHHAVASGDAEAIRDVVPLAARRAAQLHAHREADKLYRTALQWTPPERTGFRAALLSACAYESYLSGRLSEALSATQEGLELWTTLGDRLKAGESLYWVSRLSMFAGRRADAEAASRKALALLGQLLPGRELAMAYNNQAWLHMLACDFATGADWSRRAVELAVRLYDPVLELHARVTLGANLFHSGDDEGHRPLEDGLAEALERDDDEATGRALWNLALISVLQHRHDLAESYIERGSRLCVERDLDYWHRFLTTARARLLLERGELEAAQGIADMQLLEVDAPVTRRIMDLIVAALARARRGETVPDALLDEALRLMLLDPEMDPFASVRAARAEVAWLGGETAALRTEVRAGLDINTNRADPWIAGELLMWGRVAGMQDDTTPVVAEPYRVALDGDCRAAASAFLAHGSQNRAVLALVATGDVAACEEAFRIADRASAAGTAAAVARVLRRLGARRVPRGVRPSTRRHPAGLTTRESTVLALVSAGLTNSAIARRLFLSDKTVEHHVSAILRKLGATTRAEAVRLADASQHGGVRPAS